MSQTADRVSIAFVDDEPQVLAGLRDLLHRRRRVWDMSFHETAESLLELLDTEPVDVIVSDVRMPGTDGVALLERVRQTHPDVVRLVLSGQIGDDAVGRTASLAHASLGKPCDPDELAAIVDRVLQTRALLDRDGIAIRAAGVTELPLVPSVLWELRHTMARARTGAGDVARVVSTDVGLAARVLWVVNSAAYSLPRQISALDEAVAYLGLTTIEAITVAHTARGVATGRLPGWWLDRFEAHSTEVAARARALTPHGEDPDAAFAAGLLHDVGQLVLAGTDPAAHKARAARALADDRSLADVEFEELACTHATVGGHLLAFWSLPPVLVEAVARHHDEEPDRLGPVARAVAVAETQARETVR